MSSDAAILLLHDHGLPGREYSFLVTVSFGLAEVLDHREPHRLRSSESEQARVADIQ
jgi:hypothetical protein